MSENNDNDMDSLLSYLVNSNDESVKKCFDQHTLEAIQIIENIQQRFSQLRTHEPINTQVESGQKWGHLIIRDKIATGGMGDIYIGYDETLNRNVAVKFLNKNAISFISSKQFIAEARRMAKVRHPHVLAVYGAQSSDGITGFWAELLKGQELEQFAKNIISKQDILDFAYQLSTAVQAIHKKDIIHADIKPKNVIIEPTRGAVLMDFGAGYDQSGRNENEKTLSQTPMVMAPELYQGKPTSRATDIYALGILFYYMSNQGNYPFKANSLEHLKQQVTHQTVNTQQLNGSRQWRLLIENMLQPEPRKRPGIDQVVSQITKMKEAPVQRLKKIAIYSLLALMLGISSLSLFSYYRIKTAKKMTDLALLETNQFNQLMYDFLSSVSPSENGKDVLMLDVLSQFADKTRSSEHIQPKIKAKILGTLGMSQYNLGSKENGLIMMSEAIDLSKSDPLLKVNILLKQAHLHYSSSNLSNQHKIEKIEKLLQQVDQEIKDHKITNNESLANFDSIRGQLAYISEQKDKAIKHLSNALSRWQNEPKDKNSETQQANIYLDLGNIHSELGQLPQSLQHYQAALELYTRYSEGKINSNILSANNNLALIYSKLGDKVGTLNTFKQLYQDGLTFYGHEHTNFCIIVLNLVNAYNENTKYSEAMDVMDKHLITFENFSTSSPLYMYFVSAKADTLKGLKQYDEAIKLFLKAIELFKLHMNQNHEMVFTNQNGLADTYLKMNQPEQAKMILEPSFNLANKHLNPENFIRIKMEELLAWSYYLLNENLIEAESLMTNAMNLTQDIQSSNSEDVISLKNKLQQIKTKNVSPHKK